MIDTDQDGLISAEELTGTFSKHNLAISNLDSLIAAVDRDDDGKINLREFEMAITPITGSQSRSPYGYEGSFE